MTSKSDRNKTNLIVLSLLMAILFLLPLVIKAEHHIAGNICREQKGQHIHEFQHDCKVCSFNFYVFSADSSGKKTGKQEHSVFYSEECHNSIQKTPAKYSFLLRAPPGITI